MPFERRADSGSEVRGDIRLKDVGRRTSGERVCNKSAVVMKRQKHLSFAKTLSGPPHNTRIDVSLSG